MWRKRAEQSLLHQPLPFFCARLEHAGHFLAHLVPYDTRDDECAFFGEAAVLEFRQRSNSNSGLAAAGADESCDFLSGDNGLYHGMLSFRGAAKS